MSEASLIVAHNVVSMRAEPDSKSEILSQLLFGDTVALLSLSGEYAAIKSSDGYEGWVLLRHLGVPSSEQAPSATVTSAFAQLFASRDLDQPLLRLSIGSRLRIVQSTEIAAEVILPTRYSFSEIHSPGLTAWIRTQAISFVPTPANDRRSAILTSAHELLGTPYLWGGGSAFGIDCSGFVQLVFGLHGIALPRDVYQQAATAGGTRTNASELPQPAEIVFFQGRHDPRNRGITHVGIALSSTTFLHAASANGVSKSEFADCEITTEYSYRGGFRCGVLTW